MNRQIFLPVEVKKQLEAEFKTTTPTVWAALNYKTKSSFAKMLRAAALERGGAVYGGADEEYVPNCDTTFNEVDQTMVQTFSDRVRLIVKFSDGAVEYWIDNEIHASYENLTVAETGRIQKIAEEMASALKNNINR